MTPADTARALLAPQPDPVHGPDSQSVTGVKADLGKPRWDLLPWCSVARVVEVLTWGAVKYSPDGWKTVPEARARYFAAAQRHLTRWWLGERCDEESGLPHLAHAVACLLFLMWFERGRP